MDEWLRSIHAGEICSLLSAVFWAHSVIVFRRLGEDLHALGLNIYKSVLGLPCFLLLGLAFEPGALPSLVADMSDPMIVAFLSGVVGVTLADSLFFAAINRIGAGLAATLATLYTPATILWAFLFLDESITPWQLAGAGLVVAATASIPLRRGISEGIPRRRFLVGVAASVLCSLCASGSIIWLRPYLMERESPMLTFAGLRVAGGLIGLLVVVALHRHRGEVLASLRRNLHRRDLFLSSFIGGVLAMACWVAGYKYTSQASLSAMLNQLSTIFIFVLGVILLREPAGRARVAAVVTAVTGVFIALLAEPPEESDGRVSATPPEHSSGQEGRTRDDPGP